MNDSERLDLILRALKDQAVAITRLADDVRALRREAQAQNEIVARIVQMDAAALAEAGGTD